MYIHDAPFSPLPFKLSLLHITGITHCYTLLHIVTHYYTLLHTVTHCYTLLHIITHCYTLLHTVTHCYTYVCCYTCDSRSAVVGETPDRLTTGLVSNFSIDLTIENLGLDAFLAQLSFAVPTRLLEFVRVEPRTVSPLSPLVLSSLSSSLPSI